jgi:drug/metabolite transporter (DMT)-like permease
MNTGNIASITTIVAEIALALHPILIKQVAVGLPTQLLARLGTYSVLGGLLAGPTEKALSWGSFGSAFESVLLGLMNLVHIGSSYFSYQHLPAGSALALFYTYPFINILAGVLFLGESFEVKYIPLFMLAFLGVLLISNYTGAGEGEGEDGAEGDDVKVKKNIGLGVAAALVSAVTETMIFLVAKTGEGGSPWLTILRLYPAALVGLVGWIGFSGASWKTSVESWIPLLLFNVFIGFLGYSLRFWSIPRLATAVFSLLTFIGVAAGYGWGLMYAKEVPSAGALLGAGCITGALAFMQK